MGYYVGKAGLNLKKDMELQLCNNNSAKIITGDTQGASPDVTAGRDRIAELVDQRRT